MLSTGSVSLPEPTSWNSSPKSARCVSPGIAAPSTTKIGGKTAIRVALTNHRTTTEDLAILADAVRRLGKRRVAAAGALSSERALALSP